MITNKLWGALSSSEDGVKDYYKLQLKEEYFKGEEVAVFTAIDAHVRKYGVFPSKDTIEGSSGILLPSAVPEPPEYYKDQIVDRHVHLEVKRALLDAGGLINKHAPVEALELLKAKVREITVSTNPSKVVNYATEGLDIITSEYTKKLTLGDEYGISMGWPYLDDMITGLQGGDVVTFVGRPASGKTYMLLYVALNAWRKAKVPLFVSMEMKPLSLIQRLAAIDTSTSATEIKKATLSSKKYKALKGALKSNTSKQDFWFVDGALASTIEEVISQCHQFSPDVLFIDGAYLLRSDNKKLSRWDRVTEIAEMIKGEVAEKMDIPVIITYQLNRDSEKVKGDPGLASIAYTDAIGQLSSVVIGLMQEHSVETLIKRKLSILKGRNGEVGEFFINWLFDSAAPNYMDFSQHVQPDIGELQFI